MNAALGLLTRFDADNWARRYRREAPYAATFLRLGVRKSRGKRDPATPRFGRCIAPSAKTGSAPYEFVRPTFG